MEQATILTNKYKPLLELLRAKPGKIWSAKLLAAADPGDQEVSLRTWQRQIECLVERGILEVKESKPSQKGGRETSFYGLVVDLPNVVYGANLTTKVERQEARRATQTSHKKRRCLSCREYFKPEEPGYFSCDTCKDNPERDSGLGEYPAPFDAR